MAELPPPSPRGPRQLRVLATAAWPTTGPGMSRRTGTFWHAAGGPCTAGLAARTVQGRFAASIPSELFARLVALRVSRRKPTRVTCCSPGDVYVSPLSFVARGSFWTLSGRRNADITRRNRGQGPFSFFVGELNPDDRQNVYLLCRVRNAGTVTG